MITRKHFVVLFCIIMGTVLTLTIAPILATGECNGEWWDPPYRYYETWKSGSYRYWEQNFKWTENLFEGGEGTINCIREPPPPYPPDHWVWGEFLRLESCPTGDYVDVYDATGRYWTDLPDPWLFDAEESHKPYPFNDEETEVGTKDAHEIEPGKWYYVRVEYTIKEYGLEFGMRFEVEYGDCSSSPPEDWCWWDCVLFEEG